MKKKNYLTSALLVGGLLAGSLTAGATVRTVKLNTSKPVGTEITLQVNRTYAGVTVDWGDGQVETYKAESGEVIQITGTVKGSFSRREQQRIYDGLHLKQPFARLSRREPQPVEGSLFGRQPEAFHAHLQRQRPDQHHLASWHHDDAATHLRQQLVEHNFQFGQLQQPKRRFNRQQQG